MSRKIFLCFKYEASEKVFLAHNSTKIHPLNKHQGEEKENLQQRQDLKPSKISFIFFSVLLRGKTAAKKFFSKSKINVGRTSKGSEWDKEERVALQTSLANGSERKIHLVS